MLLILLIGWVVVLPAIVVGALLVASSVLGRRARRAGAVEATALAYELARLADVTPQAGGERREGWPEGPAEPRPVGAAY